MGFLSPTKPAEREYAGEGYEGLAGQLALQPGWAQGERQWLPYWAGTGNAAMQAQIFGTGDTMGALAQGNKAAGNTLRNMERWSPALYGMLGTLGQQAQSELADPYSLSPAEVREITQASMANPALASFGGQPRDAYLSYANLGNAAVQRAAQRRGFAENVMGLEQAYRVNPALQTRNTILGSGLSRNIGPSLLSPWNAYMADIKNTNLNADASAKMAGYNTRMAMLSNAMDTMGGGGSY